MTLELYLAVTESDYLFPNTEGGADGATFALQEFEHFKVVLDQSVLCAVFAHITSKIRSIMT